MEGRLSGSSRHFAPGKDMKDVGSDSEEDQSESPPSESGSSDWTASPATISRSSSSSDLNDGADFENWNTAADNSISVHIFSWDGESTIQLPSASPSSSSSGVGSTNNSDNPSSIQALNPTEAAALAWKTVQNPELSHQDLMRMAFRPPLTREFLGDAAFPPLTAPAETAQGTSQDTDLYQTLAHLGLGERELTGCTESEGEENPHMLVSSSTPSPGFELLPNYDQDFSTDWTRDEAFLEDQLTPPSFLNSAKYRAVRPSNFSMELQDGLPIVKSDVLLHLVANDPTGLLSPDLFTVSVTTSSGSLAKAHIYSTEGFADRFFCSVSGLEPGPYEINAYLGLRGTHHINGSPLRLHVSPNYWESPTRPILSRMMTSIRQEGDNPELQISAKCKICGITNNPVTEEIFAADRDGHEILCFSTTTGTLALRSKIRVDTPQDGKPFKPTGIDFDTSNQRIIVTDKDNHRVCILKPDGSLILTFGSAGHLNGQLSYPWGVAVSPDGQLIVVADSRNHRLQLFTEDGQFLRKYTVYEAEPFLYKNPIKGLDYPRGICFDKTGEVIYVSDFNLRNVLAFNVEFTKRSLICPIIKLVRPQGLATDAAGNLFICDSRKGNGDIHVVAPGGEAGASLDQLLGGRPEAPIDITVCGGGRLCILDMGGTRIRLC